MPSEKPRVLFFIDSLKMGGAERITVALLPHFTRIEPVVCTLHDDYSPLLETARQFESYELSARKLIDKDGLQRFLDLVQTKSIDLIHAQLQHATIYAAIAHRRLGIPVLTTRHVIYDDESKRSRKIKVRLERFAIRHATQHLVFVSQACKDIYQPIMSDKKSPTQSVIYNGIDLDRFQLDQTKESLRQRLGFSPDKKWIVMVGVMRPGKGHFAVIEAAKQIPDAEFLLVGDGDADFAQQVRAQAANLANLHLLGNRMDVPDILCACDLFILPSDSEALPTVLIEAGAARLPVVATDVGGVSEIVQDQVNGLLIEKANTDQLVSSINTLLEDENKLRSMGDNAYRIAHEKFAIEKHAEMLTQLYEQMLLQAKS
ncbi:glycosyltransferase family 4 protein [Anaerolineales bacterium]